MREEAEGSCFQLILCSVLHSCYLDDNIKVQSFQSLSRVWGVHCEKMLGL